MTTRTGLDRRTFLRAAGCSLALHWLECMTSASGAAVVAPRRMVAVHVALGIEPTGFFPQDTGRNYQMSSVLEPLARHRRRMTVLSGLDHPTVNGGHKGIVSYLTSADTLGFPGYDFKNTISLDQYAAERIGAETRFPSLQLACTKDRGASSGHISWSREGQPLLPMDRPRDVYAKLFVDDPDQAGSARLAELTRRKSILDRVLDQTRALQTRLGSSDRSKIDEYLTSIREIERRIEQAEAWVETPKPDPGKPAPQFNSNASGDLLENLGIMYDLVALALKTDSTRLITLEIPATNVVLPLEGVTEGYHGLSHHGKRQEKIDQLHIIDREYMNRLAGLLDALQATDESGEPLLDNTTVLFGSNLGNASSHSNRNLPLVLAGGPFDHGQHLAFTGQDRPRLANLFVGMLQGLGIETDQFGDGRGTLGGLEPRVS